MIRAKLCPRAGRCGPISPRTNKKTCRKVRQETAMFKSLRFYFFTLLYILGTTVSFILGGAWMWYGTAFTFIVGIGFDLVFKISDTSDPHYGHSWIMDALLHLNTALSVVMLTLFVW